MLSKNIQFGYRLRKEIEEYVIDWHWDNKSKKYAFDLGKFLFSFIEYIDDLNLSDRVKRVHKANVYLIGMFEAGYGYRNEFNNEDLTDGPFYIWAFESKINDSKYAVQSYKSTWKKLDRFLKTGVYEMYVNKIEVELTAEQLFLFTDGSVNTTTKVGFGAFIILNQDELLATDSKPEVCLKQFEDTSSVKLELQTLLSALTGIDDFKGKITVYTDSQNIIGLPGRRTRLEKNDYYSKGGRRINNYELYQQFYQLLDELNCEFIKIKGHKKTGLKNNIDRLFTLVDRASRNAVRGENYSQK